MINAYFILHSEIAYRPYNWDDPPEWGCPNDIVLAETRGKAKYLFWKKYAWNLGDLSELNVKTSLVEKNVERFTSSPLVAGVVDINHPLHSILWLSLGCGHKGRRQSTCVDGAICTCCPECQKACSESQNKD